METRVYANADALADAAGGLFYDTILLGIESRENAVVILSGGNTPRESYSRLAQRIVREGLPVERILWLFADERWVPVSDPQSNEGMIRKRLLSPIGAPEKTILSWDAGSGDPAVKAAEYAKRLHQRLAGHRPEVAVMGIGADGHTASLFPGAFYAAPDGTMKEIRTGFPAEAAAIRREDGTWRLTLSPSFFSRARLVAFLAAGAEKREALARVRRGDPALPASWVRGSRTLFLATRETAGPDGVDFGRKVRLA
jgi:6-phosphogluconolactonase